MKKIYKVIYTLNGELTHGTVYASNPKEAVRNQKEINSKRSRIKDQQVVYVRAVEII